MFDFNLGFSVQVLSMKSIFTNSKRI